MVIGLQIRKLQGGQNPPPPPPALPDSKKPGLFRVKVPIQLFTRSVNCRHSLEILNRLSFKIVSSGRPDFPCFVTIIITNIKIDI